MIGHRSWSYLKVFVCSAMLGMALGCPLQQDFGSDTPTDLSGLPSADDAPHPDCEDLLSQIQTTPDTGSFAAYANLEFTRYATVVAPNGGVIPIFAQDNISDTQLIRARQLLRFFLTDVPDSKWGEDKSTVANMMANNGAALMMPNGEHEEGNEPNLPAQPLYENETPADGSAWFMNNNFDHRDAAFEEIFHLVHDMGIGTFVPGALPEYQDDLDQEARAAIDDGRWGIPVDPGVADWLDELEQENSLAQEYIASVIDSYYGLWGPWEEDDGGMWGIYIAKTRQDIDDLDPNGKELLEEFLPPIIETEVMLDPELDDHFQLTFTEELPYTHKSQYFSHVTLSGAASINLLGNAFDNTLRGNDGDNLLHGGDGVDTVVLCAERDDVSIRFDGDTVVIESDYGVDRLQDVEFVHFLDGRRAVADLE